MTDIARENVRPTFVSFTTQGGLIRELIPASAVDEPVNWTVHPQAQRGDLVAFYCVGPLEAFVAYGQVLRRRDERWGRRRKPMAEVGLIRLFRRPLTIRNAKRKLGLPWLRAAQGFELHPCEGVEQLIALGNGA